MTRLMTITSTIFPVLLFFFRAMITNQSRLQSASSTKAAASSQESREHQASNTREIKSREGLSISHSLDTLEILNLTRPIIYRE
jgi:hypothetical protein